MKIRNALILLASVPSLLAYGGVPFKEELTSDNLFNWLGRGGGGRGGRGGNLKTEEKLHRRDDGADTCSNSQASEAFLRFTGIFFGDFITSGGQDILGPLAVRGNMSSSVYTINGNHNVDCSDVKNNLNGYGLVVGGFYNGGNNKVHGAIYLPAGTDTSTIQQLNNDCPIITDKGTGLVNFDQTYTNAVSASEKMSSLDPTHLLDNSGTLSRLSSSVGNFDIITMDTCKNGCTILDGKLSDPTNMLYGKGNWNGPQDMSWPEALIVNIPVTVGSTITISGNQPSLGISPCTTIYNIYPSDPMGNYFPGRIYIDRNTGGQLGGLTLAPEADINESGTGNFAGLLVANNYNWQGSGVELHDYVAIGGVCTTFLGCLPISNNTDPLYPGEFLEIPPDPSISEDFSTVTGPLPSTSEDFSTVSSPYILSPTGSDITDLPSSSSTMCQTVGDTTYITVTVTATPNSGVSSTIEEVEYCTYGGYPHIHEDEWHDHYDHQEYDGMTEKKNRNQWQYKQHYHNHDDDDEDENDDDDDDDDEEDCDENEEYSHAKHYHKGKGNKEYRK